MRPIDSAASPSPDAAPPAPQTVAYTIRGGDTLGGLAARLRSQGMPGGQGDVVRTLMALNPQLSDPDRIERGAVLQLPDLTMALHAGAPPRTAKPSENLVETFRGFAPPSAAPQAKSLREGASVRTAGELQLGRTFPESIDGTPMFRQADPAWGARALGDDRKTIAQSGCAMTSTAMALSKLSGELITPKALDQHLDDFGGYIGNALDWQKAGDLIGAEVDKVSQWDLGRIDRELEAGHPVVLGVDYKGGVGTDHWVCLTRRDEVDTDRYFANDPSGGEITLRKQKDGRLLEEKEPRLTRDAYRSSGEFTTFELPPHR